MNWTWKDDTLPGGDVDDIDPAIHNLIELTAARLTELRRQREERHFIEQSRLEECDGDWDDGWDDEETLAVRLAKRRAEEIFERAEEAMLLQLLDTHGARMCRPYEHWNEDERLMEYLERDRF